MASLLSKSLPPEWSQGEAIFWYHGSDYHNHPGLGWLELVWNYFRTYFTTNDGLCDFTGLPLIPHDMSQVPISLSRLQQPSKIVVKSLHDEFLDETLIQSLKHLGLVIIQECPSYLTLHPAVINAFIYPPSPHGVLKALSACSSVVGYNKHSLTDEGKRSLRKFFSKESSLEPQAKQLLRTLPLFETLNKCFVSGEEGLCAAPPEGSYPVSPRQDLIDVTHDDSKRLARLLGIRCFSPIEFFLEILIPDVKGGHYSNEEMDRLMGFVMERFQVFAGADPRFLGAMKSLPFVPSKNRRVRAMDLFDPGIELLKRMLAEEDVFPVGEQYTNPAALVVLSKLGMKSEREISAEDLYCSARKISQMSNLEEGKRKSETIMLYLESNSTTLQQTVSGVTLTQLLRDVPWVSEVNERPFGVPVSLYSTKETSKAPFYKPTEVTSEDKVNLIGTVKPIVRVDSSSQLAKCFGWDKMPDALDVAQHLKTVVSHYTPGEKQYYISIVKDIYAYLNQAEDPEAIKEALQGIENSSWIWNGDGFSPPGAILAERPPIDLTPFISSLPSEVLQFSNFFSKFGMKEHCDSLFFVQVLHLIKQKYESGHEYSNTEVKRDLQLSADILNEIKPNVGEQLPSEIQVKVLIPTHVEGDSYVRLVPVKDCMYCDHEWLEDGTPAEEEKDCFFVHPNISNSTAELLQVRTLRNQLLEADEIGDEFGQEEKLTRRLNKLLEEYTDGFSVPKELIQNADDAGATEVRFLYDERTNEDAMTCLIDEGMKECQGPALWVYNDAEFKDEDFENITKLNGGTKEQDTEKIGKFGLGFNTVYNLTDVPMFLSRNYFVIFDPNTFYLGKAIRNKRKPGIRIDVNKKPEKKRKFKNQFKPFNDIFGCDLHLNKADNSFPGTLFRFPLRTREQAVKSEIKQLHYDNSQMRDLLEIFVRGAKTLLLFTQNVFQVSILHLPRESMENTQPKLMFQVTKSLSEAGIIRELSFPVTLQSHLRNHSPDQVNLLKQCNFLRALSEVVMKAGDAKQNNGNLLRSSITVDITSNVTESGRSFFGDKVNVQDEFEVWLVASSMGKGQAMQYSVNDRSLLPAAAVAVQLIPQESAKFAPKPVVSHIIGGKIHHNGTVFCYLPLPIHSGLPVHINGAFAVASSRRHLQQKTEDDKACAGVEWNNVLLNDSVCAAYLDLLEDMKQIAGMYLFHTLWPRACEIEPSFEPLARSFYQQVASGCCSLFTDGNRWTDINHVVFLDPYFRHDQLVGDISFAALKMLVKENEVVVDLPKDVFESFFTYDLEEKIQLKMYDKERFFSELLFPNITSLSPHMRDKLVLYALDDAKGTFDRLLQTHACIPASPGGKVLKNPAELVNPNKKIAQVFNSEDQRFPFGTKGDFLDTVRLAKLEQLGMMGDDAPWGVFEERANSIRILNEDSSKAASERAKALIDLLERKLCSVVVSGAPEIVCKNLLRIKFLPVAAKPENFPLPWRGGDRRPERRATLVSPEKAFQRDQMYLVCCSEYLVDLYIPFFVAKLLQLDKKKPTIQQIVRQLDEASTVNENLNSKQFEEVSNTILEVYKYLNTALFEEQIDGNQVRSLFQENRYILVGSEFVHTKRLAFSLPVDCSPYLQKLPDDLAMRFQSLMKSAGVKQTFEGVDFITSLEEMKTKFQENVLDKENLQTAVNLARQLGDYLKDCDEFDETQQSIYLPDSQGVMRLACELCVDDCEWIDDETGVCFANNMIPHPSCILLGVKTRREEAINRFAVGIPFGQKEKLTNRIRFLLTQYPSKKEILKEIVQNADDAEATEICFIKDPTNHCDERVFEDSWRPLQGPALCVYNNKPFRETDIEGIQTLGEGSKGDDPNKTGQYGVGFNVVYHLTDVPSFTSSGEEIGDVLCVFDPHCKYIPGATQQEPGMMFRKTGKLRGMFPDVFSCYLEEQFPTKNSTMFRFPLRTTDMAENSDISSSPVTLEDLESMMEALKSELFEVLLFVNNIRKITLCHIDESGEVVSSYFVEANVSANDASKREQFANFVKQIGKVQKENADFQASHAEMRKCSYVLNLKDSFGKVEKWLIVQQIGFDNEAGTKIADGSVNGYLRLLPRGGVACPLQDVSTESESLRREHKAYCFLPLPVETGLPLHINGNFALDHATRRNLWTDKNDPSRIDWNNGLIKYVIASCYLTVLDKVRSLLELPVTKSTDIATLNASRDDLVDKIRYYERLFPLTGSTSQYWVNLVASVYQGMNYKRMRLLPVVNDCTSNKSTPRVELKWLPPTGNGGEKAFFNTLRKDGCFEKEQHRKADAKEKEQEDKRKSGKSTPTVEHKLLLPTGNGGEKAFFKTLRNVACFEKGQQRKADAKEEELEEKKKSDKSTPSVDLKWFPPTGNGREKAIFNTLRKVDCFEKGQQRKADAKDEGQEDKKTSFEQILLQTGFNIVALNLSVYKAMKHSSINPCFISPSAVMEFYKSFSCEGSVCKIGSLPIDVKETPFKNVEGVLLVLKYCKDSETFLADLTGLPLLVTQDNRLQAFSASEPKFLSRHHSLLPRCRKLFVHSCLWYPIFSSSKSLQAPVFKHFEVESFAVNLHQTLPRDVFYVEQYVKWYPEQKTDPNPNPDWIQRTWKFLNEEASNALKETKASKQKQIKSIKGTEGGDEVNIKGIQSKVKTNTRGLQESDEMNTETLQLTEEEKGDIIGKVLQPLRNWAILPCTKAITAENASKVQVEHFLVPLSLAETVLDLRNYESPSALLVAALKKLRLPELNYSFLPADSPGLAPQLVASLRSPSSLLTSFRHMLTINSCALDEKLKNSECLKVLTYFNESLDHLQEEDKLTLRQLPFYETKHGGLVRLQSKSVYVVPSEIPGKEMQILERQCNVVFLASRNRLSSLFEFLAFELLSPIDLYCNFILKHFWLFPAETRLDHLKHIRDKVLEGGSPMEEKRLLNSLTDTEIVPSKDGSLKKASCYYDHTNEVFRTILTEEMFLPETFKEERWMSFWKTVGLIHEVSSGLFKRFATEVSREGATQRTVNTDKNSFVLVNHLFSRDNVLEEGILQDVRDIRFVVSYPVGQELRSIHRQFGQGDSQTPYIAFQGSVLQKDAEIAWTTAPILPEWAVPSYNDSVLYELNVLTKPTLELVTSHLENIACAMVRKDESEISREQFSTRMSVMAKIYRFLQKEAMSSTFVKNRLKDTPCILVEQGSRLVNAEQVVIELYENLEIRPYLYKMPAEHGEFKQFFEYLGSSPSVQLSHYTRILDLLHEKCLERSLDVTEQDISFKAVKGIFEILQGSPDGNHSISSLYLPAMCLFGSDEDETARPIVLRKATELLFDDAPHYHDRIRNFQHLFVVDLKRCNVCRNSSANYRELVLLLPAALQPKMLSTALEEKFAESRDESTFLEAGITCSLKRMLHSEEFYRGIVRLIRHSSHKNQQKVDEHFVTSLKTTLNRIELRGVRKIVTHLLYNGIVIPGSEKEVPYFLEKINKSGEEIWNVYISAVEDVAENMSAIDLTLSQVINGECNGLLQDTVVCIPSMLHSQPSKVKSLLDRMKIRQDDSLDSEGVDFVPEPGSFIPIADHQLLSPAFKPFLPGEHVGYEVEDPSLQLEEGDATYIYAIIVHDVAINEVNLFSKSYKIDIGHETVAPATDLYQFCRSEEILSTTGEHLDFQSARGKQAILDDVSSAIREAYRLPEDKRRNVIKRLFLQWYPDRNPGNKTFCSQVFQHFRSEIQSMEGEDPSYDAFFYYWEKRARRLASWRQEYLKTYSLHYGEQTWVFPPSFCKTNPQPGEAKRWLRQAEDDLAASRNDIETHSPSYVWACFKCHQVRFKRNRSLGTLNYVVYTTT